MWPEGSLGSLHAEGCPDFADSFHESGGQIPRILPGGRLCHRRRERREDRAQRLVQMVVPGVEIAVPDRKSTRLNSSHLVISYAVFCLKKKKNNFLQYPNCHKHLPFP